MLKKLILTMLLTISAFGYEIVIDKTVKELDFKVEKKSTLKRDDAKEIVIDSATGIVWQDDRRAKSVLKDWDDAKEYCEELVFAGDDNWYLPSIKELESITDTSRYSPAIKKVFVNVASSFYWSSSTFVSRDSNAWFVYLELGSSDSSNKAGKYYVRCVRTGQ